MNRQQTQKRNWNISQLRGMLIRIPYIIPQDIEAQMQPRDLRQFKAFTHRLLECIEDTKIKRFTCDDCVEHTPRPTKNKLAVVCTICGSWEKTLYNIKRKK